MVFKHLCSLDVSKSTGPDGLSAYYLKEIAVEIVVPLTYLYNKSVQTRNCATSMEAVPYYTGS